MPFSASPKFPGAIAGVGDLLNQANLLASETVPVLLNSMAASDTSFTVETGQGIDFPTDNFEVTIESEIIFVLSRTGDVCSGLTRGAEGTTAASHASGVKVNAFITAKSHNQDAVEINAIEIALGANLANVIQTGETAGGDLTGTYPNPTVHSISSAVALPNGSTATTQTSGDNSAKVATDAFVQAALPTSLPPNGAAGGDLSGTYPNPTVAQVNGAAVPTSKTVVGTDGSGHIIDASAATLANNTTGTAANLSGTPVLPNGTTATTQAAGDNSTKLATTAYADGNRYFPYGGDGSDGAVTFDGTSTVLGLVPSGNAYTLTRDIFCTVITINNGVTVNTGCFAICCQGTLTNNGTIQANGGVGGNGNSSAGSTGGTGGAAGTPVSTTAHYLSQGGTAGGAGGNGSANNGALGAGGVGTNSGVAVVPGGTTGVAGGGSGNGGAGGTGTGGSGHVGNAGGVATVAKQTGRNPVAAWTGISVTTAYSQVNGGTASGSGGGGGGGDTVNLGGGGGGAGGSGAPGGIFGIFAKSIVNAGTIQANGGNGGNGGNGFTPTLGNAGGGGAAGGGAGGNGGVIWLVYLTLSNTGTIQAAAGNGGTAGSPGSGVGSGQTGGTGTSGSNGVAGVVIEIQVK